MIQYPTNVYPQNQAFDATANNFSEKFVFNGDYLSGVWTRIFNYDTGEMVKETIDRKNNNIPLAYNGDEYFNQIENANLSNGGRYVFQMMLMQRTGNGYNPLCDMPVIGGKVELSAENSNVLYIAKGITAIYPWGKNGNTYTPRAISQNLYFNPMQIQIGNVKRTILSYEDEYTVDDKVYGKLTLDNSITADAGDYYRIYSNALITPQYFFKCNSTPTVTQAAADIVNGRIEMSWVYDQTEGVPMKYYTLRLWWSNNEEYRGTGTGNRLRLIEETNRIYSQKIYYKFEYPFYHDYDAIYPDTPDYYRVEIEGVTQDGMTFTAHEDFGTIPHDYRANDLAGRQLYDFYIVDDKENGAAAIYLRGYTPADGDYYLFRRPLRYNETTKKDEIVGEDELVGWAKLQYPAEGVLMGYDLSNSEKGKYQYTLMLFSKTDGGIIIPAISSEFANATEENADEIAEIMAEIEEKEIDITQTVYGNINTNWRQIIEWSSDNLTLFKNEYESWGYTSEELANTISTVMGASAEFEGVEIAFSPILQTDDGAVLLDDYTVYDYIWGLINEAGEGWTKNDLLQLDAIGLEYGGKRIKNLIADVGETAAKSGEAINYTGNYGALALAERSGDFPNNKVECNGSAYYITALYEAVGTSSLVHTEDIAKRKTYRLGDTWKFMGEISNTTVTNNLDTMVHVGYSRYISTTSTDVNYESGTLSAMLGYVDCVNRKYVDDIALVKAWRSFITQKVPFLLKSQKGDVWVVNVVENPTTEYDETVSSIPTTFSFSWAECDSVDNIILKAMA